MRQGAVFYDDNLWIALGLLDVANRALLAIELYERTGTSTYLDWSRSAYVWTQRCLGTSSGLVQDHIDLLVT